LLSRFSESYGRGRCAAVSEAFCFACSTSARANLLVSAGDCAAVADDSGPTHRTASTPALSHVSWKKLPGEGAAEGVGDAAALVVTATKQRTATMVTIVLEEEATTGTRHYADGLELCRRLFIGAVGVAR
jgi:hypothetical protein